MSVTLFKLLEFPVGNIADDPHFCKSRDNPKQAQELIKSLQVINDDSERARLFTNTKTQLQFLLQIIEKTHKIYPDSRN